MCAKSERQKTIAFLEQELARLRKERVDFHLLQRQVEASPDPGDVGAQTTLRRQDMCVARRLQERRELNIRRIERALERFRHGWNGTCVSCGEDIPAERLIASPGTTHCVACKEREERSTALYAIG